MDETIGAKAGRNDRRRRMKITAYELKKLLEYDEEQLNKKKEEKKKKRKELERLLRRRDFITFIKISPIIIFGNIFNELKKETEAEKILKEYERIKKEQYYSNPHKESKNTKEGIVIVVKEKSIYKIIDSEYKGNEHEFLNIEILLNQRLEQKVKVESLKETKVFTDEEKKVIEELTPGQLLENNEKEVLRIKIELDQILKKYNAVVEEKEYIEDTDDIDLMIAKTEDLIKRLEEVKKQEEKLDKKIEVIVKEDKSSEEEIDIVCEFDLDVHKEIVEELNDLKEKKEELEEKKEEQKELNLDEYNKKKDSFKYINDSMNEFIKEQERLISSMNEKLSQDINYQDKLNIRFETINESTQRALDTAHARMNGTGPFAIRALSALSAMTLGVARNILFPETRTEITREAIIEDYSKTIEDGMSEIESAISSLDKNINEIDDVISEMEELYPNFKEAEELSNKLRSLQDNLQSKKDSLKESEKIEENLYQRNNEKVLRKM